MSLALIAAAAGSAASLIGSAVDAGAGIIEGRRYERLAKRQMLQDRAESERREKFLKYIVPLIIILIIIVLVVLLKINKQN